MPGNRSQRTGTPASRSHPIAPIGPAIEDIAKIFPLTPLDQGLRQIRQLVEHEMPQEDVLLRRDENRRRQPGDHLLCQHQTFHRLREIARHGVTDPHANVVANQLVTFMAQLRHHRVQHRTNAAGVVAASVSAENDGLKTWLAEHRLQRTQQIVERLRQAVQAGELPAGTDADSLGDFFAVFLHGLSIQARDGVTETRLLAAVKVALTALGDA